MDNQTLAWIHLSDLHMESEDIFDRRVVLEALWKDIESHVAKGILPDFIAFTGDVSYHGSAHEYDLAVKEFFEPLLAVARVPKERLYVVPGNHDANWAKTSRLLNPIPSISTENDIRKLLESSDEQDLLLSPFSNYTTFFKSYLSSFQKVSDPAYAFSQSIEKGDISVSIVGMNSAWLSGFCKNVDGRVEDMGHLAIGEIQVREATPSTKPHFRIALVHHPFDWLMEIDRSTVEDLMTQAYSIVLRGHLHRPDVIETSNLAGNLLVIPAGSVYDTRKSLNAYNIVQVNLDTGKGTIYLRRYNGRRNEWQKDIESTGEDRDGQVPFKLPKFWFTSTIFAGKREPSSNLRDYTCVFTEECKLDMLTLNLTEDAVVKLVQGEFQSHLNYFRFDIEDYPLPVRTNHIVYLDKNKQRIEFKRVIPCTRNEAKLASWNDILTLYRRATRQAYREDPSKLLFVKGMIGRVAELHLDMESRIEKHYREFDGIEVQPTLRQAKNLRGTTKASMEQTVPASADDLESKGDEIAFHLLESSRACREVYTIVESIDTGDITDQSAMSMIVTAFERSLQHIHKIILRYPPVDR